MSFRDLSIALLLAFAGSAHAEFRDVLDSPAMMTPLAKSSPLLAVAQAGQRLVAVGQRGHILVSDNGGADWTQVPVPVSSDLTAVFFASPSKGWAVGHDGVILATEDGGEHWQKQLDGRQAGRIMADFYRNGADRQLADEAEQIVADGADKPFLDVWFADETTGYVVGAFNLIFKTTDGGHTWQPLYGRTANPQRLHLYALQKGEDGLYIAGEGGLLLHARPGSDDFTKIELPYDGSLFGLRTHGKALLVFGLRGNLFRSEDGGAHWSKVETGERSALVGSASGQNGRISVIAQSGAVLTSDDDFQHFKISHLTPPMPLCGGFLRADDRLVLVGFRGAALMSLSESAP